MRYCLIVLALLLPMQTAHTQQTIEQLLQEVRNSRSTIGADYRQRINDFIASPDTQKARLSAARAELFAARQQAQALAAELASMPQPEDSLPQDTEMTALLSIFRQYAIDTAASLKSSLVAAQIPGRAGQLLAMADDDHVPTPEQLREFHFLLLDEIAQAAKVVRFESELVDAAGVAFASPVVRVGMFNLIAGENYLTFDVETETIQQLPRQPARRHRADAQRLFSAEQGVVPMAIDPTAGQLLSLLIQAPGIIDRIRQGGFVAYTIVILGVFGLLISLYRLFYLAAVGRGIRRQLVRPAEPDDGNALGRILKVYADNPGASTETLELRLDEAIITETPRLERWHVALKVIAAVAPLLGLLGTVIGMIETFQQITLFGTSDPRLMADGISKALITTMLGLLVAIPVVLLHSMVAGRSKRLIEILEEQSAGIIAEQSEKRR